MQVLKSYQTSQRWENTAMRVQSTSAGSSKLILVTALLLFPSPDQGPFFPSCHSKHPKKSDRRQAAEPGAHHSLPPWASFPHQRGHLCLSSGDTRLSKRGAACQEATGKPHPDHHQHRQKSQPKHWGSSLFPICRHRGLSKTINHQCHFLAVEMSCYFLSLSAYNLITSEENSSIFQLLI